MQFVAEMNRLAQMLTYVRTEAASAEFDTEEVSKIELATEEALVNIIHYAYAGKPVGGIVIECHSPGRHILEIILIDQGPPFNPLEGGETQPDLPLEKRKVGGLGLFLMRSLMDQVGYQRQKDRNILTMVKRG